MFPTSLPPPPTHTTPGRSPHPPHFLQPLMVKSLGECGVLNPRCASGGEEVLLDVGGQDATEAFEDVGHSDEAREILEGLLVGDLKRQVRSLAPPSSSSFFLRQSFLYQYP